MDSLAVANEEDEADEDEDEGDDEEAAGTEEDGEGDDVVEVVVEGPGSEEGTSEEESFIVNLFDTPLAFD